MAVEDAIENGAVAAADVSADLREIISIALEEARSVEGQNPDMESCVSVRLGAFDLWAEHATMLDEELAGLQTDIASLEADGDPELASEAAHMERVLDHTRQVADFMWAALEQLGDMEASIPSLEELPRRLRALPPHESAEPEALTDAIARVREICAGPLR